MRKLVFTCFPFLWAGMAFAQERTVYLGAGMQAGFIIPHSSDLAEVSKTNPLGIQLELALQNHSRKSWLTCNCHHKLGLMFSYHDYRNPAVLGRSVSLSGYFEPWLAVRPRWNLSIRGGLGMSYLSRVYDEISNPDNLFFSHHLSFLLYLGPVFNYRFNERWQGKLMLTYNHISNGGQGQPNLGMNYPMAGAGLDYMIGFRPPERFPKPPLDKSWQYQASLFGTTRDRASGSGRTIIAGITADAFKPVSTVNALGAGLEYAIDRALDQTPGGQAYKKTPMTFSPVASHHFLFGKVDFSQYMGYYLFRPYDFAGTRWFQRYALMYRFSGHFRAGFSLKAHGHIAQNIDIRIGVLF